MNLVSIVVAVYNAEKYLHECMRSIINQTYNNLEIICVNDGSIDNSLHILEEYARVDTRIKIYTKENEGLGAASARNYGLQMAHGKYVSILDSDDFFDEKMIEKAVERAEFSNADIVVFGGCEYDNLSGKCSQVPSILNRAVIPKEEVFNYENCSKSIFQLTQGMAWNKLFRKEFIDVNNLTFQKIKYTDDAYFTFLSLVLAERISIVNENLCYYRVNTGVSQTDGLANYPDSAFSPYIELYNTLNSYGIYKEVEQSFLNCAMSFMRYFYDKINRYDAFETLHNKLRDIVFIKFNIPEKSQEFFYDERVYLWIKSVIKYSASEVAFKSARAFGSGNTTSSLRFVFPYKQIPRGCKVAIVGAGIIGRHFYSQIVLNSYCDIVCWVETENEGHCSYIDSYDRLDQKDFDYVVIAYTNGDLIKNAREYLKNIGCDSNKVIIGYQEEI